MCAAVPHSRLRRRRWRALALVAALLALAALYLRADKRQVFGAVAGELAHSRRLEETATALGAARLFALENQHGETVASVWVRRPARLREDYRIVLVYAGQRTGRKVLDLVPERDDVVLVAPLYPYETPKTLAARLRWPYDVRRAAFRTVAGGLLAVTHLELVESLDPRRLLVVGASLGSAFAVIHGALDPRVPKVLVVHGGGDWPLVIRTVEARRGRPRRGRLGAALASVLVDTFDPLHYVAEIAPRELVVIGARGDQQFPAASTQALYDRAGPPKTLRWTSGRHLRSSRDEALEEVLAEIARELDRVDARSAPAAGVP